MVLFSDRLHGAFYLYSVFGCVTCMQVLFNSHSTNVCLTVCAEFLLTLLNGYLKFRRSAVDLFDEYSPKDMTFNPPVPTSSSKKKVLPPSEFCEGYSVCCSRFLLR